MTFRQHLVELRNVCVKCIVIVMAAFLGIVAFSNEAVDILLMPYKRFARLAVADIGGAAQGPALIAGSFEAPVMAFLKAALYCAFLVSMPLLLLLLWQYFEKALYPHEKRKVALFGGLSVILFLFGIAAGFFVFVPYALYFLVSFGFTEHVQMVYSFSRYLDLMMLLTFVVGLIFQIPVLMAFFSSAGLVSWKWFLSYWRHFLVVFVVMAAIITPPDAVSQVMLAIPMAVLYFLGVVLAYIFGRKARPTGRRAENR